jgi:ribosome modulation factor
MTLDTNQPKLVRAYLSGSRAARDGKTTADCPYRGASKEFVRKLELWWMQGFRERQIISAAN